MEEEKLLRRITLDPNICHGKPTIRGLRYPVESILEYLAGGDTIDTILEEFPDLEREDILACLAYAIASIKAKSIIVFPSAA
ncbi:MAG: DUF433 domain-containing protein [Lewinellaceae bacterium]|nr:DUF433 domain-containing protein [Phaeodactylibacter sp.]MCB0616792.1 DUF433 domain-containing protein [Phaeodactylibacter sp.]MCB9346630.1 DUF433 domain-containing protein [Lewinellaceae bacterium]